MVWPIAVVVENDDVEITNEFVVNEYDVQASEIIIGAIVTKFEVDNEALAMMLMACDALLSPKLNPLEGPTM
jgi:hypothetical protein